MLKSRNKTLKWLKLLNECLYKFSCLSLLCRLIVDFLLLFVYLFTAYSLDYHSEIIKILHYSRINYDNNSYNNNDNNKFS